MGERSCREIKLLSASGIETTTTHIVFEKHIQENDHMNNWVACRYY